MMLFSLLLRLYLTSLRLAVITILSSILIKFISTHIFHSFTWMLTSLQIVHFTRT